MNKAFEQTAQFKNTTAAELFDIFLDSKKHSAIHGAVAKVSKIEGDNFTALNGNLKGKNLLILPNKMIVQSWRGNVWKKDDPDSILSLFFTDIKGGAQIQMVHAFTPIQFDELWKEVYWEPIREYLLNK